MNPITSTFMSLGRIPLYREFGGGGGRIQTYTPPTPPAPTPPPAPPAPKAATSVVRDQLQQLVPKRGRRSTFLTSGMTTDNTDGRGRTLLGTPLTK